jgi:hypothetical protein
MDWAYGQRFSADGKQILFGDQHSGDLYGSFLRNLDGSPAVRLGDGDPMDLSPDGKFAVSRLPDKAEQLELLPTGTGDSRQLTHTNITFQSARWLTNEHVVANGNEPGHPVRSYLIDLQGNIKPLTAEGVRVQALSSDGKKMLTSEVTHGVRKLTLSPVDGGPGIPAPDLTDKEYVLDFTPDGNAIYVQRIISQNQLELWQVDLAGNKRTLLHSITAPGIPAVTAGLSATISRDGKSYAFQYHPALSTEYVIDGLK